MLDSEDSAFRTLWEYGYVLERGKVHVASTEYGYHLSISNVRKQPFRSPCTVGGFQLAAAKAVPKDYDLSERYVVSNESLHAKDRELFMAIANTITNRTRRDLYEQITSGSGLGLIRKLSEEISNSSVELGQWAAKRQAEGQDETCSVCQGRINGGRHLRKDCPEKSKVDDNSRKTDRKAKGKDLVKGGAKIAGTPVAGDFDAEDVSIQLLINFSSRMTMETP